MLIEPNALKPEAVHLGPSLDVFLEGARPDLGVKPVTRQRIRQKLRGLGVLEVGAIGDEIEQKNLHGKGALTGLLGACAKPWNALSNVRGEMLTCGSCLQFCGQELGLGPSSWSKGWLEVLYTFPCR